VRSPPPAMPQQRSARTSDTVGEARLRHEEGVGGRATLRATSATWTTALVVLRERGVLGSTPDAQVLEHHLSKMGPAQSLPDRQVSRCRTHQAEMPTRMSAAPR
jgi:hypothetical protein